VTGCSANPTWSKTTQGEERATVASLSGSQELPGRSLEAAGNRRPREMTALDRTRLTGPLRSFPILPFLISPPRESGVRGQGRGMSRGTRPAPLAPCPFFPRLPCFPRGSSGCLLSRRCGQRSPRAAATPAPNRRGKHVPNRFRRPKATTRVSWPQAAGAAVRASLPRPAATAPPRAAGLPRRTVKPALRRQTLPQLPPA
jgi:hypothetical protein